MSLIVIAGFLNENPRSMEDLAKNLQLRSMLLTKKKIMLTRN